MIYDRTTQSWYQEKPFGGPLLRLMYTNLLKPLRPLLVRPVFSDFASEFAAKHYDRKKIDEMIRAHGIQPGLFEGYPYDSFRDFFLRRYKKEHLPVTGEGDVISPSDGKVVVYPITDSLRVQVKGVSYSVRELLGGSDSANLFRGGQIYIIRLTLDDCHRFIYTENGQLGTKPFHKIRGVLHTVSSYSQREPVLKENERRYSIIETRRGILAVMEAGALMVGRIRYHRTRTAVRYAERGWFEPGGSTIILMYQKDMVIPDLDIVRETASGNEVRIRMGERIGAYVQPH